MTDAAPMQALVPPPTRVLDATDVARTIDRLAHQIVEKCPAGTSSPGTSSPGTSSPGTSSPGTVLMGIPTRGVPLARRLAERVRDFGGPELPTGSLDITLYRDDLRLRGARPIAETREPTGGIDGRTVLLVDDVLCSGRSARAALDALRELGRPRAVQLVALVDRGHRELPIRADYVGKNLPTSPDQQVRVHLLETDDEDGVYVT